MRHYCDVIDKLIAGEHDERLILPHKVQLSAKTYFFRFFAGNSLLLYSPSQIRFALYLLLLHTNTLYAYACVLSLAVWQPSS